MNRKRFAIHDSRFTLNSRVKWLIYALFILNCALFVSCHRNYPKEENKIPDEQVREHLMNANKLIVRDEAKDIDEFLKRHQWKMQMTGTGLRYEVYEEGKGANPEYKSMVTISYKVSLLDGTLCYSFDDQHAQKLPLSGGDIPRGLAEGLMKMKEGSKARIIVPYHLGYGMIGDQNKIPSASTLIYDVHLLRVEN